MAKRLTAVYTLAHLCVDFGCHYAFFALFLPGLPVEAALGALIYNALAFALQPFIGVWYDGRRSLPLGAAPYARKGSGDSRTASCCTPQNCVLRRHLKSLASSPASSPPRSGRRRHSWPARRTSPDRGRPGRTAPHGCPAGQFHPPERPKSGRRLALWTVGGR